MRDQVALTRGGPGLSRWSRDEGTFRLFYGPPLGQALSSQPYPKAGARPPQHALQFLVALHASHGP